MEKGKGVMGSGRRWAVDFTDNSTTPSTRDIADPPGFSRASQDQDDSTLSRQKKDAEANWKSQKAWEVAQAPFKNLMMMGFMMWMAGSTVHLFSIGITFSALWQPISALQGVGKVFEPYKDSKVDLLGPKLLFIALNLGGLALGVWKLNTLGLLPTHASDWVSSLPPALLSLTSVIFWSISGGRIFGWWHSSAVRKYQCLFTSVCDHLPIRTATNQTRRSSFVHSSMEFTPAQLIQYNGTDPSKPIYVAIKGRVFDVTTGKSFYGPGGAYAMFAGKDASRALAKMSKNDDDVTPSLDGLTEKEMGVLSDWEKKFEAKYPVVGRVV
ncbi:hypothetical protein WN943_000190 [Citrus x changshan-huyou]